MWKPVDFRKPNNVCGLVIADAPSRISITTTLDSLNLGIAEVKLASQRTELIYRRALMEAMLYHLTEYGREGEPKINLNTLMEAMHHHLTEYNREEEPKINLSTKTNQQLIRQFFEVAQVTLGIKNPTVQDLKKILGGR